jgi:hypothetical protein
MVDTIKSTNLTLVMRSLRPITDSNCPLVDVKPPLASLMVIHDVGGIIHIQ